MGVSSKPEVCGNLCQCQANNSYDSSSKSSKDNLFSPIKKMKVLKKIKKRMGLGRLRSVPLRCWLITAADPKFPEWSFREKKERPQENCKDLIMIRQLRLHFSGGEMCILGTRTFSHGFMLPPPESRCILLSVLFTHLVWTKSREKKKHSDFKKPIWVSPRCADENEKN